MESLEHQQVEKALTIALEAHRGQRDKYAAPYVLHTLRILSHFSDPTLQQIAILHDVVEDSPCTLDQLRKQGFSEKVVQAVDALTRREDEPYDALIGRASEDALALKVKLADLEDNMDIRRMHGITEKDRVRLDRYRKAHARLLATHPQNHHTSAT